MLRLVNLSKEILSKNLENHDFAPKVTKIMQIRISSPLEVFCMPLKLYTTNFQGKRSNLRCDPPEQEKLQVMKMLTGG